MDRGVGLMTMREDVTRQIKEAAKAGKKNRNIGPNSALFWLPNLEGMSMPRTEIVLTDFADVGPLLDGKAPKKEAIEAIKAAARRIGYPVFVRTDLASAKHDGPESYRADEDKDITTVVARTMEFNELASMMGLPWSAFLVREFLDLDAAFSAFGGHPIAREWRFFTKDGKVICKHFYWPAAAIKFHKGHEVPDWQKKLAAIRATPSVPMKELEALAEEAVSRLPKVKEWKNTDGWSVDFAKGFNGKWYLIDMAVAAESWHPDSCKNSDRKGDPGE
jgi:hypothetical protein